MVEHAVKKDLDAGSVARVHHGAQVVVGAEATVDLGVVARVVAVRIRLEDGVQQQARHAQLGHMVNPAVIDEPEQAMLEHAVVLVRCPTEAQRVNLIDKGRLIPAHRGSSHQRRGRRRTLTILARFHSPVFDWDKRRGGAIAGTAPHAADERRRYERSKTVRPPTIVRTTS